jgi:Saxitoxin biosynthesis operon protein SxtJ
VVGIAFLGLGAISYWRGHSVVPTVFWVIGGALVGGGLLLPGTLGPVYRAWMRFGLALSKVTTPLVMGVIYFGLFTPMGLLRRAFGRDALVRRSSASFWISRSALPARRSDLRRQF